MTLLLYSFRRCPYAIRARLALAASGVDPELREVDLKQRPAHLRQISPKATVPVLQLEDGTVLDESLDVIRWALGRADPRRWLPVGAALAETDSLLAANDGDFKRELDRFKYANRYPDSDPIAARDRAEAFVAGLDRRLGRGPFLFGDACTLADVALFPFVRQFAGADPGWFAGTPHGGVRRWLAAWEADPTFRAVMAKLPPWRPDDPPLRFRAAYGLDSPTS